MEGRSQERDMELPVNSIGYSPPQQISQESPVKLPLAPIDRRPNAMVSSRRGSSIFSPTSTQTLDHHHHHHNSNTSTPQPQLLLVPKDPTPDPEDQPQATAAPRNNSTTPPISQQQAPPPIASNSVVMYKECLKNHAASMGAHFVDGCGEFMPSGDDGTAEALKCAACDCHRNFHRKEVEGGDTGVQQQRYPVQRPNYDNSHRKSTALIHHSSPNPIPHRPVASHHHHQPRGFATRPTPPTIVNFGGGGAAESSSEDLNMFQSGSGGHAVVSNSASKKRFRTKFSQDQKDQMQEFATKLGWRIQKPDEQEVQRFCGEVGVKRQVFKVWMHNNKQAMKRRSQGSD